MTAEQRHKRKIKTKIMDRFDKAVSENKGVHLSAEEAKILL